MTPSPQKQPQATPGLPCVPPSKPEAGLGIDIEGLWEESVGDPWHDIGLERQRYPGSIQIGGLIIKKSAWLYLAAFTLLGMFAESAEFSEWAIYWFGPLISLMTFIALVAIIVFGSCMPRSTRQR